MKVHRPVLFAALVLAAGAASAQLVSSAVLERPAIGSGEAAKLTVGFDVLSGVNCGLRVHWGDGAVDNFKINQPKDVPLVVTHSYAKAGTFTVKVEPKTQGLAIKCGGDTREVALTVNAAAKPAPVKPAQRHAKPASATRT